MPGVSAQDGPASPPTRLASIEAQIPSTVKGKCGAMTKPRVTTADRLSNVIEVVELGRRSGLLTVERGSNQALEQGEVYFSQGRAIYALVEGLRGREALTVLAGWGQCRFAFEPNASRPAPNVVAPPPAQQASSAPATFGRSHPGQSGQGGQYPPPPQRAQPTPPRGAPASFNWDIPSNRPLPDAQTPTGYPGPQPGPQTGPQTGPQRGSQTGALPFGSQPGVAGSPFSPMPPSAPSSPSSFGASWPTGSNGWSNTANGANGASQNNTSGQLNWPSLGSAPVSAPSSTGPFTGGAPVSPQTLERRPRRAPDVRDLISVVSAYNLSRNHRTILLLADGEHTVLDLARLSSKQVEEIVALLADLERLGLVYYY